MVKLVAYTEFKDALEQAAAVEEALLPNELEMLHSLIAKYGEPLDLDPFDVTALEVILRNVEVRKGYRIDVKKDPARVIDLPRVKE
ncbi:MAG: hypothetical protein HOM52_18175 [Rhodospirillaceae bacterium]|jgi:hypothetical protein|nr:hypothetical protein [Rhodospirillaceae bacterium]MBT3927940.1 hypothetical protein [Rhodospirillaceae bacterium]MBT4427897.1 hypothetical protein [Rhodospirillaceae bacterium]MBT5040436.1 hypothetical protein [Rhodospirillaceae bacterium]MBT5677666.1 hypothetical protein [Rhodospirillaceae bacterium]